MAYNKKLLFSKVYKSVLGFPHSSVGRDLPIMQETWGLSLGQEDPLGEGNGNPLQYSCLGNPTGREAWQATVHGVAEELDMT